MDCCTNRTLTRASARDRCTRSIHRAVKTALSDETFGVVVDALPTLGKSRTAATLTATTENSFVPNGTGVTILTHRKETRNQLEQWAEQVDLTPHQLPILDEDCPTAAGAFGKRWSKKVQELRSRGLYPGHLHSNPRFDLPCTRNQTCPYIEGWENSREHQILIGHPTHAYVSEIVRDRIVIFDEDPGEAFRSDFDSNSVHRIVSDYLTSTQEVHGTHKERVSLYTQSTTSRAIENLACSSL